MLDIRTRPMVSQSPYLKLFSNGHDAVIADGATVTVVNEGSHSIDYAYAIIVARYNPFHVDLSALFGF